MHRFVLAILLAGSAAAQPAMRDADRVRIAEAFHLAAAVQDEVWPGWRSVPFAVLLVTPDDEFLVGHPRPSDDFALVCAHDSLLGPVYARPRQFSPALLATFPAVGGVSTVVVGTPEQTGRSSTAWVVTLLHEHAHQMQASQPGYYAAVEALGLTGGDTTGTWMLNYPFPYTSATVRERFAAYRDALATALGSVYRPDGEAAVAALLGARSRLREALGPADDRYLAFQQWQEGVARYTEHRVAAAAAKHYDPLPAFLALPDAVPYAMYAGALRRALAGELASADLADQGRVAFYATGAAEALLLDTLRPGWQRRYAADRFSLAPAFDAQ